MRKEDGATMNRPTDNKKMPLYLDFAVRFGTTPSEWPDAAGCYERVFAHISATEGERKAKRWAARESLMLFVAGIVRILTALIKPF
jgi:hypothetical protein